MKKQKRAVEGKLKGAAWPPWLVALLWLVPLAGIVPAVLYVADRPQTQLAIDPTNGSLVGQGKLVYAAECASCHGTKLEGQPDWKAPVA